METRKFWALMALGEIKRDTPKEGSDWTPVYFDSRIFRDVMVNYYTSKAIALDLPFSPLEKLEGDKLRRVLSCIRLPDDSLAWENHCDSIILREYDIIVID